MSGLYDPPATFQLNPYPVTGAPSVDVTAVQEHVIEPVVTGQTKPEGALGEVNGASDVDKDCGEVNPKLVARLTEFCGITYNLYVKPLVRPVKVLLMLLAATVEPLTRLDPW